MAVAQTVVKQKDILLIMTEREAQLIRAVLSLFPINPKSFADEVNSLRNALNIQGIRTMSYEIGLSGDLRFEGD